MSHEIISCLMRFSFWIYGKALGMRISHETRDFLMRQETGDFLIGGAQNRKDMRFSLET